MNFNKNINDKKIPDWVELYVIFNLNISKTDLLGEFDNKEESFIDDLFLTLSNRLFLYGEFEPYKIEGDMIISNLSENNYKRNSYIFSLFLATYGNGFETNDGGKIFERISNEAFKEYLGGESIVFGFPDGITGGLKEKIDELAQNINERRGAQNPLNTAKDDKLDLVSFKNIDDRENKLIFLVQSAAGGNWKNKLREISIQKWNSYINFGIIPIRGFSTPVFIDNKNEFYSRGMDGGLIFDRARIYRFISKINGFSDGTLDNDLISWNRSAISNFS